MTTQSFRLRIVRAPIARLQVHKPALNVKVAPRINAGFIGDGFIAVSFENGEYTIQQDYALIGETPIGDPTAAKVVVLDQSINPPVYRLVSAADFVGAATQIVQDITAPGPAAILPNAGIVRAFAAVGGALTLTLPLAAVKTCPVLISDWTLGAGVNNITINTSGADKLPGNLASWKIAADTGSVFLRPVNGGYVL